MNTCLWRVKFLIQPDREGMELICVREYVVQGEDRHAALMEGVLQASEARITYDVVQVDWERKRKQA